MPIDSSKQRQIDCLQMRLIEFGVYAINDKPISAKKFAEALWDELLVIHVNDALKRAEADCEEAGNGDYADES